MWSPIAETQSVYKRKLNQFSSLQGKGIRARTASSANMCCFYDSKYQHCVLKNSKVD